MSSSVGKSRQPSMLLWSLRYTWQTMQPSIITYHWHWTPPMTTGRLRTPITTRFHDNGRLLDPKERESDLGLVRTNSGSAENQTDSLCSFPLCAILGETVSLCRSCLIYWSSRKWSNFQTGWGRDRSQWDNIVFRVCHVILTVITSGDSNLEM